MALTDKARRRTSLEWVLPGLIFSLLFALVGVGSIFAYGEVRRSAIEAGEERLDRITGQLVDVLDRSFRSTLARMRVLAADDDIVTAVVTGEATGVAHASLETLMSSDDAPPVELWDASGAVVAQVGRYPEHWDAGETRAARDEAWRVVEGAYGPIFFVDRVPYAWITVPVLDAGGDMIGQVARVGAFDTPSAAQVDALIGSSARLFLTNAVGGPWVSLGGDVVDAPAGHPFDSVTTFQRAGEERFAARARVIGAQPLAVVVEESVDAALARAGTFLRRLIVGAALLLLAGAGGAWLLSRRITRPLRALRGAARDLAAGDYSTRVTNRANDELGDLADSFSHMAAEVESKNQELQRQYVEARALAERLEASNRRMIEAMLSADDARLEAERANNAKSDFLAVMSHEMRTPINAIVGYADLLQLEISGPLNEEQVAQLGRLSSSTRHLLKLVDEVLDLARVETGRLQLERGQGAPAESVRAACSVVAPEIAAKGIRLEVPDEDGDEVLYRGDPRRVEQILINLLANAVKFTPAGGNVTVRVERGEPVHESGVRCVSFVVEDEGIGIPADQQEAIFEPFVQVETGLTRSHGGAGLGLAISRRLARMMGGDIAVSSEQGRGSRFTLELPLVAAETADVSGEDGTARHVAEEGRAGPHRRKGRAG